MSEAASCTSEHQRSRATASKGPGTLNIHSQPVLGKSFKRSRKERSSEFRQRAHIQQQLEQTLDVADKLARSKSRPSSSQLKTVTAYLNLFLDNFEVNSDLHKLCDDHLRKLDKWINPRGK